MPLLPVPHFLQPGCHSYPPHSKSNIEQYFFEFAQRHLDWIPESFTYIPILWTNNYYWNNKKHKQVGFHACPRAQAVLDELDPKKKYFTVVQCDDGIYERLPENVMVFGAGGEGHVPVPLLSDPFPAVTVPRTLLGSFAGQIECGGPEQGGPPRRSHSTWDPDGAGAKTRRAMLAAFAGQSGFEVGQKLCSDKKNVADYPKLLCRSIFTLCPRGYGRTSFRMYEAMQLGSIPVYIYDDFPWLPFSDQIDWHSFCILCRLNELQELPDKLRSFTHPQIQAMQNYLTRVARDYFTYEATCVQIIRILKQAAAIGSDHG